MGYRFCFFILFFCPFFCPFFGEGGREGGRCVDGRGEVQDSNPDVGVLNLSVFLFGARFSFFFFFEIFFHHGPGARLAVL